LPKSSPSEWSDFAVADQGRLQSGAAETTLVQPLNNRSLPAFARPAVR